MRTKIIAAAITLSALLGAGGVAAITATSAGAQATAAVPALMYHG